MSSRLRTATASRHLGQKSMLASSCSNELRAMAGLTLSGSLTPVIQMAALRDKQRHQGPEAKDDRQASDSAMRSVYIETYGCQMNLADSELLFGHLGRHGYQRTDDPA